MVYASSKQPPAHAFSSWASAASGNPYSFYICPQPPKHLAAGPDGLGDIRIDLIPKDGFGKGKMDATHAVFERVRTSCGEMTWVEGSRGSLPRRH